MQEQQFYIIIKEVKLRELQYQHSSIPCLLNSIISPIVIINTLQGGVVTIRIGNK